MAIGKFAPPILRRPVSDLLPRFPVEHGNRLYLGNVDENPLAARLQLKGFRVRAQRNIGELTEGCSVDYRERPVTVSHEYTIGVSVDPDVVRVVAETNLTGGRVVGSAKSADGAIACIRYVKSIDRRKVADALRLLEARTGYG